jgi:hypothetical protein
MCIRAQDWRRAFEKKTKKSARVLGRASSMTWQWQQGWLQLAIATLAKLRQAHKRKKNFVWRETFATSLLQILELSWKGRQPAPPYQTGVVPLADTRLQ